MENALYVGLSQQMVLERQMDIVANNIANLNTTGFKAERPVFEEYLMNAGPKQKVSFVLDYGNSRDTRMGNFTPTGAPLDIALNGTGFLSVQTPDGVRYTRNGHLNLDADGRLVTREGYAVLDDGGGEITIDQPDLGAVTIAEDGTVSQAGNQIGAIGVVKFGNDQQLRPVGNSLYEAPANAAPEAANGETKITQGMLEDSNVQPVVEITRMIELQRRYQTMQNLLQGNDDLQKSAIQRLGRVGQA